VFFKYFKSEIDDNAKVYYLKKISGMDNLHEMVTNTEKTKAFIDYGTDVISLTLNEDVTQNMGYLSSLYKMLAWSRINGKQVIPTNLLRFEAEIVISDVRNYNMIVKNDVGLLTTLADNISKYVYTLYDCQFMFKMPHGNDLDMTSKTTLDGFDVSFDYKFSTMKFERYTYDPNSVPGNRKMVVDVINNANVDVTMFGPGDTNNSSINVTGSIEHKRPRKNYNAKGEIFDPNNPTIKTPSGNAIDDLKKNSKTKLSKALVNFGDDIVKAAEDEGNRAIVSRYRLVNKSIDNIRNRIPYSGRMSEPTNVYNGENPSIKGDTINAARDFVGPALKSLFDKK
jgi:hypothetical protein